MLRTTSPLRYPGGKSCLYKLVAEVLRKNRLERVQYAEPYAGGCGLALSLLFGGHVSEIVLNDLDPGIFAFWSSVLNNTSELLELVSSTPVTLNQWRKQKAIHDGADRSDQLALGFATFFLNRTNRSGVIKGAGVIGGQEQDGSYKIDCRFNREDLVRRIQRISKYSSRISFTNLDAIAFMKKMGRAMSADSFFCIDPPYFNKGSKLYTNFYGPSEHRAVADAVLALRQPWIVTYDQAEEIRTLYANRRQYAFGINYSIQTKRVGTELLIASKGLRLPSSLSGDLIYHASREAA